MWCSKDHYIKFFFLNVIYIRCEQSWIFEAYCTHVWQTSIYTQVKKETNKKIARKHKNKQSFEIGSTYLTVQVRGTLSSFSRAFSNIWQFSWA